MKIHLIRYHGHESAWAERRTWEPDNQRCGEQLDPVRETMLVRTVGSLSGIEVPDKIGPTTCQGLLVFDPSVRQVGCIDCGSSWHIEEVER